MRRTAVVLAGAASLLVFLRHPSGPVVSVLLALTAAWMIDRQLLVSGLRARLLAALVLGSAIAGLAVTWVSGPSRGTLAALMTGCRMVVLTLLAAMIARTVDTERLLRAARRARLERLALAFGLALNVLPRLAEAVSRVVLAWRIRRRLGSSDATAVSGLAEVLLAHTARLADEAAAAAALRGHAALTRPPPLAVPATTRLVVVTGPPGCGKTTAVDSAVAVLAGGGVPTAGFVQPGRLDNGVKVGFAVRDLATGRERELARRVERAAGEHGTRFHFFREGFALAAAAVAGLETGGLLVADELGPIELRGEGHMPAVRRALESGRARAALVVVRRQLVPALVAGLDAHDVVVIDVAVRGAESAAAIVDAVMGSSAGGERWETHRV